MLNQRVLVLPANMEIVFSPYEDFFYKMAYHMREKVNKCCNIECIIFDTGLSYASYTSLPRNSIN